MVPNLCIGYDHTHKNRLASAKQLACDKRPSLVSFNVIDENSVCHSHLSDAPLLGQAPGFTLKHQTKFERLAADKHSSLLQKYVK